MHRIYIIIVTVILEVIIVTNVNCENASIYQNPDIPTIKSMLNGKLIDNYAKIRDQL